MKKEYITINLSELKPFGRNPRKNDNAVDAVIKSINETGYISPIVIDENNEILCGHTRTKALQKMGTDQVEVLKVEGLTDEQKKRYRILDNKTGEIAEWDFEILQEDFKLDELVDLGFDIKDLDQEHVSNEQKDISDSLMESYEVVCECKNDNDQEALFLRLSSEGIKCRLLTL